MIHKEGYKIIMVALIILISINVGMHLLVNLKILNYFILLASVVFFSLIIWFFRNPERIVERDESAIYAPADGKVVVIEKVFDKEYFNAERIQVSIFMSPLNVHVNRYPMDGVVKHFKYYPGKYLVAWHPKSSELNERTAVVVEKDTNRNVLLKQIAGAVARRIVTYSKVGDKAVQGEDFGFIKFGSRVDLLLPLDAEINVELEQKVSGNLTRIATFK